jgi:hypothetical protein
MINLKAKLMVLSDTTDDKPLQVTLIFNVVNPNLDLAGQLEQYLNGKVIDLAIDEEF